MPCDDGSHTFGPIPVWSNKTSATWLFHPLTGPLDSSKISSVRASFEMAQSTGLCTIRPAIRMSNDGQTWDTPVAIGAQTQSADGTNYGTSFTDVSSTTQAKQLAQLGIECQNVSGTATEMCMASGKFDTVGF